LATSNKNFKVKNGLDVSGAATASSFVKTGGSAAQFLMADGSISENAGGSVEVSPTPPESPSEGDIWYNSTTGQTFVYYDSFWVENVTGQVGPQGPTGATGPAGQDSTVPGPQGPPGADGFIGADGAPGAQGPEGPPGPEGPEGPAGTFGVLDEAPVDPNEGDVWFNTSDGRFYVYYDDFWVEALSNEAGPQGPEGPQGPAGADGSDGATGPEGPQGPAGADSTVPGPQGDPGEQGDPGPGIAAGGTEGQVLLKVDGTDYNTTWADNSAESTFYLVRNNTGATIAKGTLVAATGAEPSGRIDVAPFEVTGLENSELRVMGVATTNISNGVNGTVMSFGTLKGIDTRGNVSSAIAVGDETWAAGDILYAHPTVDGKLTKNKPQHDLVVAFITVRHATLGQLAIRITSGTHLEWLHDVAIEEPADGDVLTYNSTNNVWENSQIDFYTPAQTDTAISTAISNLVDSAPSVLDTLNELSSALNDDPNFSTTVTNALAALVPSGTVSQTARATAPTGYLLCDGSAISRTTYSSLFDAIGTAYGVGNGSTTFNIPNLKGRVPVGFDSSQTEFDTLGESGGAKTVAITEAQMPSHSHTGTTSTGGNHSHTLNDSYLQGIPASGGGSRVIAGDQQHSGWSDTRYVQAAGDHNHSFTTSSAGSGQAHNNLQPYVVLNYMIKI
jgi:microcystin-dependent protein